MPETLIRPTRVFLFLFWSTWLPGMAAAEDWPCWRGPRSDGTSLEKNVPTDWNGPANRNIVWKAEIPGRGHASPIVSGERIFTVTCLEDRNDRVLLCLDRASGRTVWQRVVVSDTGIASCFEAATGKRHWMQRIGPHYSASLVEAEGLVHFLSDRGVTTIVRPGPQFEVVAKNELGEDCYASPAISHGRIYIRAEQHMYCIGPDPE